MFAVVASALLSCLVPPVDAPITDPFRPPECPWCPGNRGLEMDTDPGEPIVAVGLGRVAYAGSVAGTLYVTIEHPGGLRSTYGGVSALLVRLHQQVTAGQVVAAAGDTFLLTVRVTTSDGEEYVDPAPLLGRPSWQPRLVPIDGSAPRPARPGPLRCPGG